MSTIVYESYILPCIGFALCVYFILVLYLDTTKDIVYNVRYCAKAGLKLIVMAR